MATSSVDRIIDLVLKVEDADRRLSGLEADKARILRYIARKERCYSLLKQHNVENHDVLTYFSETRALRFQLENTNREIEQQLVALKDAIEAVNAFTE